jgi:RNA polymerase sigma factor (sigma-70 family)
VALAELADARDAEDAVQDSFITALERLDDCRDPCGVRRVAAADRAQPGTDGPAAGAPAATRRTWSTVASAASRENPARDLERSNLRDRLETALATLSDTQRSIVLMHDLEGYRHREIAVELGIPEGTVRSHLFLRQTRAEGAARGWQHGRRPMDERLDLSALELDEARRELLVAAIMAKAGRSWRGGRPWTSADADAVGLVATGTGGSGGARSGVRHGALAGAGGSARAGLRAGRRAGGTGAGGASWLVSERAPTVADVLVAMESEAW